MQYSCQEIIHFTTKQALPAQMILKNRMLKCPESSTNRLLFRNNIQVNRFCKNRNEYRRARNPSTISPLKRKRQDFHSCLHPFAIINLFRLMHCRSSDRLAVQCDFLFATGLAMCLEVVLLSDFVLSHFIVLLMRMPPCSQ